MVGDRRTGRKPALIDVSNIVLATWVVTLAGAAISDLRAFRISNIFSLIIILVFVLLHAVAGFSWALLPNAFHFLLALAIGMLLFGRGWIGGGDAKLYAAVALWFDWTGAVALLFLTTFSGLLLAVGFVVVRMLRVRFNRRDSIVSKSRTERRIPYGVAIALGAVLTAAWVGWGKIFPTAL